LAVCTVYTELSYN